jgi:hypothetical protein
MLLDETHLEEAVEEVEAQHPLPQRNNQFKWHKM